MCWVPPPRHTHTETFKTGEGKREREKGARQGFWQRGAAAVQPAAALKTRVRVRQAEEEYEEDMCHLAAGGTSDGARCCRCAVPGASFLCVSGAGAGAGVWEKDGGDTPPIHRRYRWWSGMLKGAVAGTSPAGPWTDRRTGVRNPDHDERQPWRIPLDRPCLLPVLAQKWYRENGGRSTGLDPDYSVSQGTGDECQRMIPDRPDVQGLSKQGWAR